MKKLWKGIREKSGRSWGKNLGSNWDGTEIELNEILSANSSLCFPFSKVFSFFRKFSQVFLLFSFPQIFPKLSGFSLVFQVLRGLVYCNCNASGKDFPQTYLGCFSTMAMAIA